VGDRRKTRRELLGGGRDPQDQAALVGKAPQSVRSGPFVEAAPRDLEGVDRSRDERINRRQFVGWLTKVAWATGGLLFATTASELYKGWALQPLMPKPTSTAIPMIPAIPTATPKPVIPDCPPIDVSVTNFETKESECGPNNYVTVTFEADQLPPGLEWRVFAMSLVLRHAGHDG
jgi:hypothetical protein